MSWPTERTALTDLSRTRTEFRMAAPAFAPVPWLLPFAFCAASLKLGFCLQGREEGSHFSLKSSGTPELVGGIGSQKRRAREFMGESKGSESSVPWKRSPSREEVIGNSTKGQGNSHAQ